MMCTSDRKNSKEKAVKVMNHSISKLENAAGILNLISSFGLALISIFLTIPCFYSWMTSNRLFLTVVLVLLVLSGFVGIILYLIRYSSIKTFERDYRYYSESKRVSTALLTAIKRTNFSKTCNILQSTYGTVPDWNPINYCENVLTYDVHQHLRNICINLKELIVDLNPDELNDDKVTVDLVYTYLSEDKMYKNQESVCPFDKEMCNEEKTKTNENAYTKQDMDSKNVNTKLAWNVISSGDRTSYNISLHSFLENINSFYSHLAAQGYVFCNDKQELEKENHYIWTSKDHEYERVGSIIGSIIELKSDDPEASFVRAYLTISTYGRKMVEDNDTLNVNSFEKLFKEVIINSYKSLIEAELAQMFIRHGIRNKYINRKTGRLNINRKKAINHK